MPYGVYVIPIIPPSAWVQGSALYKQTMEVPVLPMLFTNLHEIGASNRCCFLAHEVRLIDTEDVFPITTSYLRHNSKRSRR